MKWHEMVNKLVTQDGNQAWRVISYCDSPTIVLENCETKERIDTGIYGLLAQGWKPLIPGGES